MIIAMGVGRRQLIGLSFSYHFLSLPPTFIYFPTRHCILLLVFRLAFRRLADFAMRPDGVVVVWTTFTGLKDVQTVMQNESKIKGGVKEKWKMCEHSMRQMRENEPFPKRKGSVASCCLERAVVFTKWHKKRRQWQPVWMNAGHGALYLNERIDELNANFEKPKQGWFCWNTCYTGLTKKQKLRLREKYKSEERPRLARPSSEMPVLPQAVRITRFTKPGDLVLDVFGGTGSLAVAAIAIGRKFMYVDKDPVCADAAKHRIVKSFARHLRDEMLTRSRDSVAAAIRYATEYHNFVIDDNNFPLRMRSILLSTMHTGEDEEGDKLLVKLCKESGTEVKASGHVGVSKRQIGRGLFATREFKAKETVCFLWGRWFLGARKDAPEGAHIHSLP